MNSRYDRSIPVPTRPYSGTGEAPRNDANYQGLAISKPVTKDPKTFAMKDLSERVPFTCLAWTSEGDSLVAGCEGSIKRHDVPSLKSDWTCTLASTANHVDCLAANPRARNHVAAAISDSHSSSNASVVHYDMRSRHSGKPDGSDALGNPALCVAWHPGGTRLCVSRKTGKVSVYDIRRLGSKARAICEQTITWELNKFLFLGDGDKIVAAYGQRSRGGFKILQADTLEEVRSVECHLLPCVGLALGGAGQLLATGGNDATVTVWSMEHCDVLQTLRQPEWNCDHVGISHDGTLLAYSGAQPDGRLVSLEIAERFSDAAVTPIIHTLSEDTVSSGSGMKGCSVADLCWSPKQPVLAFCGRAADKAYLAIVTRAGGNTA